MAYDFSKVVKIGSKILMSKGKLVVVNGDTPVPPEPTNIYEVYEFIDESEYEEQVYKTILTTIFEKDSENNYIKVYFYEKHGGSEITPSSTYYLDESNSSTTELSKEGNIITFIKPNEWFPDEEKEHYTFDLTNKILTVNIPAYSITGTFTYEPEREVYETYPIPEIVSYEVYEGLYPPSPSTNQGLFPLVFGKGITGKYEIAYVFNAGPVEQAENVYYLDEAIDKIIHLNETDNIINFYSNKSYIEYTFNTSTKTLFMEGPNIQGELKTNKIVKQAREKFSLLFETEYELQDTEYLGGEWKKIEDPTRTNVYKCTLNTKIMHNSPLSNLAYCGNYGNFEIIGGENLDIITDLKGLFYGCSGYLTSFGNISFNNVTDITNAFEGLNNITSLPNINWNKIETAKGAFYDCNNLTNFLPIYNTLRSNNVIHDVYTFNNCGINTIDGREELNQILYDWGGLYIGEVPSNTIRFKFYNTGANPSQLAQNSSGEPVGTWNNYGNGIWDWTYTPDDNSWENIFNGRITNSYACEVIGIGDTSSIENMAGLFSSCYVIKMLAPEMDLSNCTTTQSMFSNCVALNTFETQLINTEKLKDTVSMFYKCTSLKTVPLFNTHNVTDMTDMFYQCSSLTTVPLFNTHNVTDMTDMFYQCSSLTTVPLFDTSNVTNMTNMFYNCTKVESGALALYQQANATGKVTSHSNTFTDCGKGTVSGLAELNQIPKDWGGLKVKLSANILSIEIVDSDAARNWVETNYNSGTFNYEKINDTNYKITNTNTDWSNMFSDYEHIGSKTYLLKVLASEDTSSVTNTIGMFFNCESLEYVTLFDTSNVTDMGGMFSGCKSLTSVPLFDTSNVTNMTNMFSYCSSLTSVPLFDTSNVTYMFNMFDHCSSLTTVPLFNTSNVLYMSEMFSYCSSLTSVPLFDTSNVTNMDYMFFECISLTNVPLFDTSNVIHIYKMFYDCTKVGSGTLALYQSTVAKASKLINHTDAFTNCGRDTTTGLAELQQIPQSWGGLAEG